MKIGLDIMGGDYAPKEAILGAIAFKKENPNPAIELVLIGDKNQAEALLKEHGGNASDYTFVHTTEVIEMGDSPTRAVPKKKDSSIVVGFNMLATGKIDAFASAGNTGAMLVGSMYSVGTVKGIIRPSLVGALPKEDGGMNILLDVGANTDCRHDVLAQFARLGSIYAKLVYKLDNPKVALMNIGEEEGKGNVVVKEVYSILKQDNRINFIGNIEGRDTFTGEQDVTVCDGFVGNIILKQAEAFYSLVRKRNIEDEYFARFNFENYGGTAILGVNAPVVIGHGISNAKAMKNMIKFSQEVVESKLVSAIQEAFAYEGK
jgi:phosphate acyltransferase